MFSDPTDIARIKRLLSEERLEPFRRLAGSDAVAVMLHLRTMRVGAALMPIVALLEIAIRNAVSERLVVLHGTGDWMNWPKPPFKWKGDEAGAISRAIAQARRAIYAKKDARGKRSLDRLAFPSGAPAGLSHAKRVKARQAQVATTAGQNIAQLTLYFWKRLFSEDYEATLWKPALRTLFPNKSIRRAQVAEHLEALYEARNRVAHHELLYGARLLRALDAIDFVVANFELRSPEPMSLLARLTGELRADLNREVTALDALVRSIRNGETLIDLVDTKAATP
jgi:hypothetical protein